MKLAYSPKLLREHINMLEIPAKEKILQKEALSTDGNEFKLYMPIYIKKFGTVAVAVIIAVCIAIQGVNLLNENTPVGDNRIIITGNSADSYAFNNINEADALGFYISPVLQEKIDEYAGQDVWFRVIAFYRVLSEYLSEYAPTTPEIAEKLAELDKKYEELEKEYNALDVAAYDAETEEEQRALRKEANKVKMERNKVYNERDDLYRADREAYCDNILENERNFAKEIGALNMEVVTSSSDFGIGSDSVYSMEVTADMITQIANRGNCYLMLATPAREDGYDVKISDTLTYYLSKMSDNDTIEVAVVCAADNSNAYAYKQGINVNIGYNKEYFKQFSAKIAETNATEGNINLLLENYVAEIVERNGLTNKRINSDELPKIKLFAFSVEPTITYLPEVMAGFNAELTKAEILALTADEDIKVIYPCAAGTENYSLNLNTNYFAYTWE